MMKAILFIVVFPALGIGLGFSLAYLQAHGLPGRKVASQEFVGPELVPVDQPQPRVEVDDEEHDFGEMERNGSGEHTFVIKNTGEGDLELVQGDTTCKCTWSLFTGARRAPGESALVTLSWRGESISDFFEQSAQIFTNDRRRRYIILKVHGRLTQPLVAVPEQLNFGDVTAGETATAQIECYVFRDVVAGSLRHKFSRPETADFFEVTQEEIPRDKFEKAKASHGYRLTVTAKSGLPLGPIQQTIRLSLEGEEIKPLEVPMVGRVVSDFSFAGPGWRDSTGALDIGDVEKGQSKVRTLIISVRGPHRHNTQINVAEVYPKFLDVKFKKSTGRKGADARVFTLVIKIPSGQLSGNFRGEKPGRIVLKTNHPQVMEIVILVKFFIE